MKIRRHARIRVKERSLLAPEAVVRMLEAGKYIPIGIDQDKKNCHKVIYSPIDDECFVAVHDEVCDELVTFLPIEYHNKWKIDHVLIQRIKDKCNGVEDIPKPESKPETKPKGCAQRKPSAISVMIMDCDYKLKSLGTIKSSRLEIDELTEENFVNKFTDNPQGLRWLGNTISTMAKRKGLKISCDDGILFRIGKKKSDFYLKYEIPVNSTCI